MARLTLHLAKQNFKFSAAHFLIFDETRAEKLHGHNYRVKVDIGVPEGAEKSPSGFFVDFNVFKTAIKARLDRWDEHVLLPAHHPDMKIRMDGACLHLNFRDRIYVFPKNEVELLPITNTSVEQLSTLLAEEWFAEFQAYGVVSLRVSVEETAGQAASALLKK